MTTIVLCGSTRFRDQFKLANYELSRLGFTVLTLADPPPDHEPEAPLDAVDKIMFDLVYFEKIRIADAVLLIDGVPTFDGASSHDPYIGFSAAREILWAQIQERPVFSLLSSSGWGNVADCLENRFDDSYREGHTWILDFARQVLRTHAGVDVVQDQIDGRQRDLLHAGLSVVASQGGQSTSDFATRVLEAALLDPHEDVFTAFAGVLEFDGTLRNPGQKVMAAERLEAEPAAELMVQLPVRKLVGAIIMVQAIRDMGADGRIVQRRKEMMAKLELTSETLLDSFGVTQAEVDRARESNGGLDFPIAE